jgi:hypothetical protein
MKAGSVLILGLVGFLAWTKREQIKTFINELGIGQQKKAMLGAGGLSSLGPLYFSGAAMQGGTHAPLAPGGAGRSTLPGVLNNNGFKGQVLNRYGR